MQACWGHLDVNGGAETWRKWRQMCTAYAVLANLNKQAQEDQVSAFISAIGMGALDVFNSLPFTGAPEEAELKSILTMTDKRFEGKMNIIYERYMFDIWQQKEG